MNLGRAQIEMRFNIKRQIEYSPNSSLKRKYLRNTDIIYIHINIELHIFKCSDSFRSLTYAL